jgi:hypothetical protein
VSRARVPWWLPLLLLVVALLFWIGVVVFGWPFAVA